MSRALTIAQRELASMFRVPAGWIIIALFAFLTGVLFVNQTIIAGNPGTLRYFFAYSGWLLIPIAPAISMRLMSEEYRSGSFEALRTAPAGDWAVTIGKYLGSIAFLILMLVPTLVYPLVLWIVSSPAPDIGPIAAGYLMLILVGMLYLGIGMLSSSLTSSQTLAFLGTVMSLILLMVLTSVIAKQSGVRIGLILSTLSITARINEFSKGIVDTATIAFFLIGSAWMLVLAAGVLEVRRLGRPRAWTLATVSIFVIATGTAAILAGSITAAYHARFDVTSTGAHELSPRALGIVDRLSDQTEIVLAIGMNRVDKRTVDLVGDVLESYDLASNLLRVRTIDLDSPDGVDQTKELLNQLADRDRDAIDSNMSALAKSATIMQESGSKLSQIATTLASIRDAIAPNTQRDANNRAVFEQRGAIIGVYARDLLKQGNEIQTQLKAHADDSTKSSEIFPFDTYAKPIEKTLAKLMNQLDDLSVQIDAFANADEIDPAPRSIARPLITELESLRDQVAIAHDQITRLKPIEALSVGRALETGEALLVIGPPSQGIAAVDLDALLPSSVALERAGVSPAGVIGPRAQELIATALAQLVAPTKPILIFIHGGQPGELLNTSALFTKTVARLAQRGIDTLEWAVVKDPSPPDLGELDPLGIRPIIFAIISVDSARGSDDSGLTGAKQAAEMGKIVTRLISEGRSVLFSLNPSVFSSFGDPDPVARALEPFGIIPDTGRPLLHEKIGALGRIADPITRLVPDASEHPIAGAIAGLNTVLPWAIPMTIEPRENAQAWEVITTPGDSETWSEKNWLTLWSTLAKSRPMLRDQPTFDPKDDHRQDSWILAAAGERTLAGQTQRVVVVGSNGWALDAITANTERLVDGRVLTRWAGNTTLLDSSIAWLAGMDDLIGPGTQARPIATIKNLDPHQRSLIRWILLAGLPGLILLLGMASRLLFG